MDNFINSIKKLFGIIITFIFGIFNKSKNDKEQVSNSSLETEEDKILENKNKKIFTAASREDEPEVKSKLKEEQKENSLEETYDNARKDLERVFYLKQYILKIEKQIEQTDNIDDLIKIKEDLKETFKQLEKIGKIYEKEKTDNTLVIDIQRIYITTKDIVKQNEKNIDKKVIKLENSKEELENTQEKIITKEEPQEEKVEDKKEQNEKEIVKQEQQIEETKEEQKEEKELKNKETTEDKKLISTLENVVIKEIEEIIKPNEKDSKIIVKKETKIENHIPDVSKEQVEESITNHKEKSNVKARLIAIAVIITKTLMMTKAFRPTLLLKINPKNTIANALLMNNQIRKTHKILGRKTNKLKYEQVIQKVGLNPENQLKFVMANSLNEIKKLKEELMQYEMTEEINQIMNQLNEMETQILEKVSELEDTNRNVNTATRFR